MFDFIAPFIETYANKKNQNPIQLWHFQLLPSWENHHVRIEKGIEMLPPTTTSILTNKSACFGTTTLQQYPGA